MKFSFVLRNYKDMAELSEDMDKTIRVFQSKGYTIDLNCSEHLEEDLYNVSDPDFFFEMEVLPLPKDINFKGD